MNAMASQDTSLTIVYSTVYSGVDEKTHQSSASLAFVRGIHRWPVNSPHKGPVTRKMFPFDDVIMFNHASAYVPQWHTVVRRQSITFDMTLSSVMNVITNLEVNRVNGSRWMFAQDLGFSACKKFIIQWKRNLIVLTKLSSLVAPEVVILTISGAASDIYRQYDDISVSMDHQGTPGGSWSLYQLLYTLPYRAIWRGPWTVNHTSLPEEGGQPIRFGESRL